MAKIATIKLEKGIPMPSLRQDSGLTAVIESMAEGDSFRIPKAQYATVRSMASMAGKSIRTRKEGDSHLRVWCVLVAK